MGISTFNLDKLIFWWEISKGRLQNPTAGWPAVPSGSGRLSLFRTIETGRNRTEPPVNRRLGFEAVPNLIPGTDFMFSVISEHIINLWDGGAILVGQTWVKAYQYTAKRINSTRGWQMCWLDGYDHIF